MPRPPARPGRPEDVQEPWERHGPVERARGPRRRRAALELRLGQLAVDAQASVAREHRRDDEPVPAHALEHLLVLRDLREPRRLGARRATARRRRRSLGRPRPRPLDPVTAAQHGRAEVGDALERFDALRGAQALELLVDDLSNWYVRRSRSRFWNANDTDAHAVLHECLLLVTQMLAPFCPFLSDAMYQDLAQTSESVHLSDWPTVDEAASDASLERDMALARQVVSLGLAGADRGAAQGAPAPGARTRAPARRDVDSRVGAGRDRRRAEREAARDRRQPRGTARLHGDSELPPARAEGRQAHAPGQGAARSGRRRGRSGYALETDGGFELEVDGTVIRLEPDDVDVRATSHEEFALAEDGGVAVALDTRLDRDLELEGLAREVIRVLNDHRKAKGLEISDRIAVWLRADGRPRAKRSSATATGSPARSWPASSAWSPRAPETPAEYEPVTIGDATVAVRIEKV